MSRFELLQLGEKLDDLIQVEEGLRQDFPNFVMIAGQLIDVFEHLRRHEIVLGVFVKEFMLPLMDVLQEGRMLILPPLS